MTVLLYFFGIMFIFASICCLVYTAAGQAGKKHWKVLSRLRQVRAGSSGLDELEPLNMPFRYRVIFPFIAGIGKFIESLAPSRLRKSLQDRLIAAGYNRKSSMSNYMIGQAVLVLALPSILILFSVLSNSGIGKIILFGFIGLVLAILIPVAVLDMNKRSRQDSIRRRLPDMLDLLVISVEAGLGFDAALMKVTEKIRGPISEELTNALSEIRMGKIRRLALREMADRTGVDELISFISAVFQADQLGVSIGNVLRVQADTMRTYRRQRAEERAAKAPVKMLFPLVFCILPSLFVVILGPAIIKMIDIFANMNK